MDLLTLIGLGSVLGSKKKEETVTPPPPPTIEAPLLTASQDVDLQNLEESLEEMRRTADKTFTKLADLGEDDDFAEAISEIEDDEDY